MKTNSSLVHKSIYVSQMIHEWIERQALVEHRSFTFIVERILQEAMISELENVEVKSGDTFDERV